MTDHPAHALKADIASLRDLTEESPAAYARQGVIMVAVGLIFGVVDLCYWAGFAHLLSMPPVIGAWLWAAGLVLFFTAAPLFSRGLPQPAGTAALAIAGAWSGVGISLLAAGLGLIFGGWRLHQPGLVLMIFPIVLFTLYGAAWGVAYAAKRKPWFAWVATGCFAAALATGALMGDPGQWLVMSIGLFVLVAAPGVVILRQARAG